MYGKQVYRKGMLLVVACFSFCLCTFAQSGEVKFLDRVNPERPTSDAWKGITNSVGPVTVLTPVTLLTTGYLKKDKQLQKEGWKATGAVLINVAVTQGLKKIVARQRPYNEYPGLINYYHFEKDSSFPSGHTSNAFATATTLSLTFKKWYVTVPAYLWAAASGYSRLYLGQHYPTDVLAGAAVGVGSALLSRWLTEKIFYRKNQR
ncbi:MAG TPA: phosphatase PAP2 family protein [Flavisolibacter sp.]|nr:phosphatase PAP2 family protein [Flavisolibacter sp.]